MNEMNFLLRTDGPECLYGQIYAHIKKEIKAGKLPPGEKLPSTRFLAEYLQVARSTVDYAYGQLLSEGYIESKPCKGYYVCPIEELFQLEDMGVLGPGAGTAQGGAAVQAMHLGPGAGTAQGEGAVQAVHVGPGAGTVQGEGAAKAVQLGFGAGTGQGEGAVSAGQAAGCSPGGYAGLTPQGGFRVDFSPYEIDMSGFPFGTWKKITKNILTYANSELFAKGEAQGDYGLRGTITKYLHSSRGVNCRPEQIIVGAGNDYLLMLLEKILGRNVRIAMENPTYKRSYRIFRSFAYHITTVDMDEAGMRADKLWQAQATTAYVMPSHQFPTGTVMPIGRRMELLKWASGGAGRYLIEDDYDSEFRFRGKPVPALQASDRHGKVIYIGTFSKAIAPAIRISFMVLPDTLLERYLQSCSFFSCTVPRIDQSILDEFIREGYFERHLNKMRKLYRAKHELLLECLQPLRGRFAIFGENAGLHLLLTSQKGMTEQELLLRAASQQVRVYGLSESMVEDAAASNTVLLGFGGLSGEKLREGTERLKKVWLE